MAWRLQWVLVKLRFLNKLQEVGDIWSFWFEPPEDLTWLAGQSIRLELPRATFGVDERRFSIPSAPHEKLVRITTRLSDSSFKQNLDKLEPDALIDAYAVEGDFVWNDSDKNRLFLAGGIGITAFRPILIDAAEQGKLKNTVLIHSFHDNKPLFGSELEKLKSLKVIYLHNSRISAENLIPDWKTRQVYISGPEKMVAELGNQLKKSGLPDDRLKLDLFTGNL